MTPKILKREVDRKVAEILGMKSADVSRVTEAFLRQVNEHLAEGDAVSLAKVGTLKVVRRAGRKVQGFASVSYHGVPKTIEVDAKYYLKCKKAPELTNAIRAKLRAGSQKEKVMDKYGVDEKADENLEKKAAEGCPVCGKKPVRHGTILMCPEHGSEPWEKEAK